MKNKFPLEHFVKSHTKEIWLRCDSAITAMGIGSMVEKYYPGYKGHIGSQEHIEKLKNQLVN